MKKNEYYSWETPPKDDQRFTVYTKKNRMIIMPNIKEFESNKEKLLRGDEIVGWKPIEIDNQIPPFIQSQIPKKL